MIAGKTAKIKSSIVYSGGEISTQENAIANVIDHNSPRLLSVYGAKIIAFQNGCLGTR